MGHLSEIIGNLGHRGRARARDARLTPEELKRRLDVGQPITVLDLRHPLDFLVDPRIIPGAIRIEPDELETRHSEIPRDREVVLYCTCPTDAASARMAALLAGKGLTRVRFLAGGLQAWREAGYPLVDISEALDRNLITASKSQGK